MASNMGFVFGNKAIKQGKDLYIKIPPYVVKNAKLKPGKNLSIILETNQIFDEEHSARLFMKMCKNIKSMRKLSEEKLRLFIWLQMKFIKEAVDYGPKKRKAVIKKFRKEYSNDVIEEFLNWQKSLNEAFVYNTADEFVVKPHYYK